ncbi:MAG: glycine cleavage system protein GcvH [Parachlamydiales bacterium]|jgi:glycine cleavage system H protein
MKYTPSHEWIETKPQDYAIVGITDYAQKELGDIVYIELPKVGRLVKAGEQICVLESTKAAADVYSPVSGTVTEVNDQLKDNSSLVNSDAEGSGWLYKIDLSAPNELDSLLDQDAYQARIS